MVDAHSEAMSSFPALRARFDTAAAAQQTMDDASARVVAQQKDFQRSALARFTGDPDPVRTVQRILGAPDGPQQMGQLVGQVKDDAPAMAGLRHAVMQRYLPLLEGQGFKQFPQALTKEWLAASKVLGPDQMAALRNIAADLKRSGRSIEGTKLPGGSNTVQDAAAAQRHGQGGHQSDFKKFLLLSLLEGGGDMLAHTAGMGGFKGLVAGTATAGAGFYVNMLRQTGLRSVDDLVALAAAHPPLMRALMAKVPDAPSVGNVGLFRQQITAALANATIQRQNTPPLATGNGKPTAALGDLPRVSAGGI